MNGAPSSHIYSGVYHKCDRMGHHFTILQEYLSNFHTVQPIVLSIGPLYVRYGILPNPSHLFLPRFFPKNDDADEPIPRFPLPSLGPQ